MRVIIIATIVSKIICLPPQDLNYVDVEKYEHFVGDYFEYYLRNIMKNKNPVLDPYQQITKTIIQYSDKNFLIKANFTDLTITNLSCYDIMYCNSDFYGSIIFGFNFPTVIVNGSYDVNIRHLENNIIGKGQFNLTITDLRVLFRAEISSQAYFNRDRIYFKSLLLKIIPGIFKISASNLYLDSEQESKNWNKKVSKLMPMMIFDSHHIIEPYFSRLFITYLNN